jgi:hypothetical protein
MAKRGRPSSSELTTPRPPVERQDRPDACYSLPDEAAEVWKATVEALPADWIGAEALPVLAAYCRTTVSLRRLGQLIHQAEHGPGGLDLSEYALLLRLHGQQAQTLKTLATALRLTPQSRYKAETAARRIGDHSAGPRPWEMP